MDTDSLFTTRDPSNVLDLGNDLGQFKLEGDDNGVFYEGFFFGPKMYQYDSITNIVNRNRKNNKNKMMNFISDTGQERGLVRISKVKGVFDTGKTGGSEIDYESLFSCGTMMANPYEQLVRGYGEIVFKKNQKRIVIMDSRRKWFDNGLSEPYDDIEDYNVKDAQIEKRHFIEQAEKNGKKINFDKNI